MKKPTIQEIRKGMRRFAKGDRPWPEREIDWYLAAEDGKLFPLKYTYGLSVNLKPSTYTCLLHTSLDAPVNLSGAQKLCWTQEI